jgi:uncharacterized protein (TIGR03067 family)
MVGLLLVSTGRVAHAGEKPAKADLLLNGRWQLVEIRLRVVDEKPIPLGDLAGATFTVSGSKVKLSHAGEQSVFNIRVDRTKRPKVLDLPDGVKGELDCAPLRCIYALNGDKGRVAFHFGVTRLGTPYLTPDAPRPTGFGEAEWPTMILSFRRLPK